MELKEKKETVYFTFTDSDDNDWMYFWYFKINLKCKIFKNFVFHNYYIKLKINM